MTTLPSFPLEKLSRRTAQYLQDQSNCEGEALSLCGGSGNVASLLETVAYLESLTNKKMRLSFKGWRPGDNKRYYTKYQKAKKLLGWTPRVPWKEGVRRTLDWVQSNMRRVSAVI